MLFHSLSNLSHWWEIYAPFQAVFSDAASGDDVHPHRGQVLRYMRRLRGKTKQEVVKALHWSPAFLRKAESSPYGAKTYQRHIDVVAHLQISPRLLNVPEDFFLPDPNGTCAALWEKIIALSGESDEREEECQRELIAYQLARDPNYLPLPNKEKEKYNNAVSACFFAFLNVFDAEAWVQMRVKKRQEHPDLLEDPSAPLLDIQKNLPDLIRPERIREAIQMVDFWLGEIAQQMEHATGFRLDQLIYVRCCLYEIPFRLPLSKSFIYTELGPEKKQEYLTRWLASAQYLGNVQLATMPLLEKLVFSLEHRDSTQAQEDFVEIQFCLDIMCNVLECFDDALAYIDELDDCICLAKGGMKTRLRNYQLRARAIVEDRSLRAHHPLSSSALDVSSSAIVAR